MFRYRWLLTGSMIVTLGLLAQGRARAQMPGGPAAVFIANGAGDSVLAAKAMDGVVSCHHLPILVESIQWSAGDVVLDIQNQVNHRLAGRSLAGKVWAYHLAHPESRVCLLSHSAGVAVVLAAVECLPPGTVDRVIILAPGCSPWYDLRPALTRVREGIDVYYSCQDVLLDTLVPYAGTTDGFHGPAAGEVGFAKYVTGPQDAGLYAKLHQYAYGPAFEWTGHQGGHCGWLRARFLQGYVVPAILGTDQGALAFAHP